MGPPGRVSKLRQSETAPSISPPLQVGWLRYHQGVEHAGQAYLRTVTHEQLAVHPVCVSLLSFAQCFCCLPHRLKGHGPVQARCIGGLWDVWERRSWK